MDSVWNKIKRFLIFWGSILLLLTIVSIIMYSDYIFAAVAETFSAIIATIIIVIVLIAVIRNILR